MKNLYAFIGLFALRDIQIFAPDMAFEPYGMFYGNVSPTIIDENVKPAYGGEVDAFLRKIVTTIYEVIRMVGQCELMIISLISLLFCPLQRKMENTITTHLLCPFMIASSLLFLGIDG